MRYVMVLIPNVADARDVVQEAAVALWDKIELYDPAKPFAPWACRFALNEAKMFLEIERMENAEHLNARKDHLRACLRTLPDKNAELVKDYYFNDLSVEELGKRLERSVDAIYKTLQRVRQSLHDCIEKKIQLEAGL